MDRRPLVRWLFRLGGAALLAALLAYLPHRIHQSDGYVRMTRMQDELADMERRREALSRENRLLEREVRRLRRDLDAIDRVARDDLGLVQPGEIVIQVEQR
jgi:cell division protein FtsB